MKLKTIVLSLTALSLAGCVSVLPEPVVPDALYRFTSTSQPMSGAPVSLPANIIVFEPEGSSLLLGRNIAYESEDGALSVLPEAEWTESASRLLQSALLDRLSLQASDSEGVAVDERLTLSAAYELHWTVRDLVIGEEDAVVTARVEILNGRTGEIVGQTFITKRESYTGRADTEGTRALIRAARSVIDEIATELPDLMSDS